MLSNLYPYSQNDSWLAYNHLECPLQKKSEWWVMPYKILFTNVLFEGAKTVNKCIVKLIWSHIVGPNTEQYLHQIPGTGNFAWYLSHLLLISLFRSEYLKHTYLQPESLATYSTKCFNSNRIISASYQLHWCAKIQPIIQEALLLKLTEEAYIAFQFLTRKDSSTFQHTSPVLTGHSSLPPYTGNYKHQHFLLADWDIALSRFET